MFDDSGDFKKLFSGVLDEKLMLFRSIAARILNTPSDADDAVQNALLKAWKKRASFKGEPEALAGWIARIVVTQSYDLLRKRMREARKRREYTLFNEPEKLDYALVVLDRAIAALPELYRRTLHIAVLSDIPSQEAAELLGVSVNTLYQRIHKAKQLLKTEMRKLENE